MMEVEAAGFVLKLMCTVHQVLISHYNCMGHPIGMVAVAAEGESARFGGPLLSSYIRVLKFCFD